MKNRKYLVMALAVVLLVSMLSLAGCAKKDQPAPTAAPTLAPTEAPTEVPTEAPTEAPTEPAPTEPAWEPGQARANYVEAVYSLLNKGDEVEVTGKYAHYYIITAAPYDLLVDQRFVRLETDEPFESHTRYARSKRPVYDNVYMNNEPVATLTKNTKLTTLEAHDDWVYVEWSEGKGYMKVADTSERRIASSSGGGGGSSSGGGGGGGSDGTNVDAGALSATDIRGGITLLGNYYGPEMESIFDAPCKGTILAEEVEAYIALFGMGEEMKVVSYDNEYCTVYLSADLTARVPRAFVKMEGDSEETKFTGYVRKNHTVLYKEYQSRNEAIQLGRNKQVEVLYKLPARNYEEGEIYVVNYDGEIMYMPVSTVSDKKIKVSSSSSGGSSGGSSSGGAVWSGDFM